MGFRIWGLAFRIDGLGKEGQTGTAFGLEFHEGSWRRIWEMLCILDDWKTCFFCFIRLIDTWRESMGVFGVRSGVSYCTMHASKNVSQWPVMILRSSCI